MTDSGVRRYLESQIQSGVFPGARYRIARGTKVVEEGWLGHSVLRPEDHRVGPDTIYDVASLTKPLVTGALSALLASRGVVDLQAPLVRVLPELAGGWIAETTLMDLLIHQSGLPAWLPLYLRADTREGYLREIASLPPDYRPRTRVVYSCLGYILAASALERATGIRIDELAGKELFQPVGAIDTGFRPSADLRRRIAATEEGNEREREMTGEAGRSFAGWRRGVIWGECHDLNAWTLGGVSGNAGLFSTAADLHRLALEFLGEGTGRFAGPLLGLFREDRTRLLNENRSLGWQLAATPGSSAGTLLSPGAMGHTGFTGTSQWIDPETGWILILLTNRVHPQYRPDDMNAVRRHFHRLALSATGG